MSEKEDAKPMTVLSVQYTEDECIKIDIGRLYCCGDLESRHHICLSEREYSALGRPSIGDDAFINIKDDGTLEMRFVKRPEEGATCGT